jgi:iron(III) transport system ATP-binding protein
MGRVRLIEVTKLFGKVAAVDNLSLDVEEGECFSFLGPSGCGKTTTLRMLAGFEDLDQGEIRVGEDLLSSSRTKFYLPPEKRNFGMVFQAFAVWPHLSVFENVAFPLRIKKMGKAELVARAKQALEHTGLLPVAEVYPNQLSGGEKQRIALARALAVNPRVMLLDEPLSNLDVHLREEMRFEIKELQRKFGFTVIYVTHDQSEAMALSDRIMVMDQGKPRQIGAPWEVYNQPADRFVFGFIGLSNFLPVRVQNGEAFLDSPQPNGVARMLGRPPERIPDGAATLACRPSEVELAPAGQGVPAVVTKRAFLGEVVDYRVDLAGVEVRVQQNRRQQGFAPGEACGLVFHRLLWYA